MNCLSLLHTRAIRAIGRLAANQSGATAIEYALMVALISIGIMATVFSTGEGIRVTLYEKIQNALASMM
jgi:Flp pilus assembly pilin Flp